MREAKSDTTPKVAIAINMAECPECLQVLISAHIHDFRVCGCENEAFVDGGNEYLRRGWNTSSLDELSIGKVNGVFVRLGGN